MRPRPGPRHRQGHGPDPAPLLRAEGHGHVPGGAAGRRRASSAAASSCSTTSGARSSARPASSAPRPARSSASTWAASTPGAATTSTGARPRRTASGARNRRCAGPGRTVPGPAYEHFDADRPGAGRRHPRGARPRPGADARDPRGDPGGLRLPAGRRAQADQPADRRLVRDDLRHRHATTATCASSRPAATEQAAAVTAHRPPEATTWPRCEAALGASTRSRGRDRARRRAPDRDRPSSRPRPRWPTILLERAGRRRPDRPRRRRPGRRLRRACDGRSATSGRRRRSPTIAASGLRGRGGAGYPGRRQVAGGRRERRRPAGSSSPTATAPTRRRARTGSCSSATRTRSSRAWRSPPSPSAPTEAIIAVRAEDTEAIRRLEAAIGAAEEAGFLGPDVLGSGHDLAVTVRPVQGAYMLGEETVLLKALEGKRGQPEQRPPHPAERGLFGAADRRPQRPDPGRRAAGSSATAPRRSPRSARQTSPGTILVQVRTPAGDGIAEVPLGTPLREIVGARRRAAGRPLDQGGPRRRPVGRPPARPTCSTRPTTSSRCAPPAPTSARAPSSSPTTGPASSTSPGS